MATSKKMDAVELLLSDHEKVKKLFDQFEKASDNGSRKGDIAREILSELEAHSKIEEEIFYPAVRQQADDDELKAAVNEGYEEHAIVDRLVEELKAMDPSAEQFAAKFDVLRENVLHHIEEEEEELLPDARERLGDQNEELGPQMMQRKQQILEQQR